MYISELGLRSITSVELTDVLDSFMEYRKEESETCKGVTTVTKAGFYYKSESAHRPTTLPKNMLHVGDKVVFKPTITIKEAGPTHSTSRQLHFKTYQEAQTVYKQIIVNIPGTGLTI